MSADRAAAILARFNAAHHGLLSTLRRLEQAGSRLREPESWDAAQIGCHVAMTNNWIAGVLSNATPVATPVPEGFSECFDTASIPPKLKTTAALQPPAVASLEIAVERLRASGHQLSKAIASLSSERGRGYCVALPFGTLSLYELAEFATAHVTRHIGQVERIARG